MAYKVVIIDDESWTREVIKSLGQWDELGLEIVGEASDGEYGFELINQLSPHIVLTDVRMPYLNGIELMTRLRERKNDVLVIIISGYDDFSYIRSALKLGATDYLLKPIKPEELNAQLRHCTELLQARKETREEVLTCDFLNTKWANEFYNIRDNIADALRSDDEDVIRQKFQQLKKLMEKNLEGEIGKNLLVCVYYTLMTALQRAILSMGYSLKDILENRDISFVFGDNNTLEEMLGFLEDLYCDAHGRIHALIRAQKRLDIDKIRQYVESSFTEGITLEETADRFYVSKEYLSRIFKDTVGVGFTEYVTSLRMKKAKSLILDYKIPLKDVGAMVGYLDQAHFYKAFKKYYGKTPGEIRGE